MAEKRALAFKIMVSPKEVRRIVAMITGEALTDEQLENRFFKRVPAELDPAEDGLSEGDVWNLHASLVALMIAHDAQNIG